MNKTLFVCFFLFFFLVFVMTSVIKLAEESVTVLKQEMMVHPGT